MIEILQNNWAQGLKPIFLREPKTERFKFKIQKFVRLLYRKGEMEASQSYAPNIETFVYLRKKCRFMGFDNLNLRLIEKSGLQKEQKRMCCL